ncbi:hypothetical protein [Microbulbifer aggregans]|uniref:hypothetical protein n=1 Tax=Microbulbifer aggregans TaxID=1769779 RepID=UPI001CFEDE4E|nr:hypothetical protein [Microbulbifer aggregans]
MNKCLMAFLGMAFLQSCAVLLPPNTPDEFADQLSDSAFGRVYTTSPAIGYQDSIRSLQTNMDACVEGSKQGAAIRSGIPVLGSGSGIWHYAVTAESDSLTQFTIRREALGLSGPQHEGGNIVAVINVEPQQDTGVSITGYSPWGSDWFMESVMAWGEGQNVACPIG